MDKWMDEWAVVHSYKGIHLRNKKEPLVRVTAWMNLKIITEVNEASTKKIKAYCMITLILQILENINYSARKEADQWVP